MVRNPARDSTSKSITESTGSAPVKSGGNFVSNAIDLQSSAGGFTRLNLGAAAPFNVTQASAVTAGFATFGPAGTPVAGLYADLSTATAATINAIRTAFQVQKLLERDARGGTRYTEIIRSHFGVVSPDARLQRPEYLGGSSVPVNIAPVAQTSASAISGSATPQGNLAAYRDWETDRKSTRLNSSHRSLSRMPSSA